MGLPFLQEWAAAVDRLAPGLLNAAGGSVVILGLACLAALAMRRASAAARHQVWLAGFAGALLLPVLWAVLPGWHVLPIHPTARNSAPEQSIIVVPPSLDFPQPTADSTHHPDATVNTDSAASIAGANQTPAITPATSRQTDSSRRITNQLAPRAKPAAPLRWTAILLLWPLASVVVLCRLLLGYLSLWSLRRRCRQITGGELFELLQRLRKQIGLRRRVDLLSSPARTMPMMWGVWRACVLLPEQAATWPPSQRRDVLLHELGHVRRWDCLSQLLSEVGCAVYWFNPLAWVAAHRMRIERERACDDLVLNTGSDSRAYARHLLESVSSAPVMRLAGAAIAMARASTLEERMRAILNNHLSRQALGARGSLATMLLLLAALLPVAVLRAQPAQDSPPARGAGQSGSGGVGRGGGFATTRPGDLPGRRTGFGGGGMARGGFGGMPAPALGEGPTCTLDATIYDVRLPVDQIGRLDVEALSRASEAAEGFEKALAALGKAQPMYRADQSVRLSGDNIRIESQVPMVTSSHVTDKGQTVNSFSYMTTGAIFTLAGKATSGGVDLDLTIQVSASSDGGATITDKVTAPVIRNATLSHKGPAQPGKPFVVVSVDAGSVDKDGRAVAYIGRITLGALNESASREMNRGDVGRTP